MQNAKTLLKRLWNEEDGVTIIEYSLLAALIAVALVTALNTLKVDISNKLGEVSSGMTPTTPTEH